MFGDYPEALREHRAHRRALQRRASEGRSAPAELRGAAGLHDRRRTSSTSCARASQARLPRLRRARSARGELRRTDRRLRAAARVRNRHDQADEVPGLLPDRLGLHPLRARAGHSGRARAAGRRPAASSPTACASPTSIRCTSICIFERFLNPERVSLPDIDIDFCERRRGEVIAYVTEQVRPRERRADHHVRHDEGARRRARRRPRHGDADRRGRPGRQADSRPSST